MESIEPPEPPQDEAMLARLRNTWEFANLMQYIFIFGRAVKIDEDFDIEVHPAHLSVTRKDRDYTYTAQRFIARCSPLLRILRLSVSNPNHPRSYRKSVLLSSNASHRIED